MILRRFIYLVAAASAVAAAAGVAVVAAAFAVYALFRGPLGPAGAAAAVCGLAALLSIIAGLSLMLVARPPQRKGRSDDSLAVRAMEFAREKPLIALGGAAIMGLIAVRNPQAIATALGAFLAPKPTPKK